MIRRISASPDRQPKRDYTAPFARDPGSVPKRWRFEKRDQTMLAAIYQHEGMLTTCQLEALFFAPERPTDNLRSAKRSAETRSQYLFHRGYLDRLPVPAGLGAGRSTIVNVLDGAGVDYVTIALGLDRAQVNWRPKIVKNKPSSHLHSLLVNDLRIVFERVGRFSPLTLTRWIGERAFKSKAMADKLPFLTSGYVTLTQKAPDGFFVMTYLPADYPDGQVKPVGFFVEVDRGTEANAVWQEKVRAYEQFRRSGLAARYYGVSNFRVLVSVTGHKRLANLIQTTRSAGGESFYWFTEQSNIDIFRPWHILEDIWQVAGWQGRYSLKSLKLNPLK